MTKETKTQVENYRYQPKRIDEIVVRPFFFEFPDNLEAMWVPHNAVRSHFWNGISLTMPYLEPYLIKTNREAMQYIKEPALIEDMKAFNGQERSHFECHRKVNELLKQNGHPQLGRIESYYDKSYKKLLTRNLRTRLAYSAGFETMTKGFTNWVISKRRKLWRGADKHMTSFWLMHLLEEGEHKTVAFDVYMAYSGKYFPRAIGVLHGSGHVMMLGMFAMFSALKKDRLLSKPLTYFLLVKEAMALIWNVHPYMLHALLPWHNPRSFEDPDWMLEWIKGHSSHDNNKPIPLVDTSHPDIPVPF